jgi:hypothetical protein
VLVARALESWPLGKGSCLGLADDDGDADAGEEGRRKWAVEPGFTTAVLVYSKRKKLGLESKGPGITPALTSSRCVAFGKALPLSEPVSSSTWWR